MKPIYSAPMEERLRDLIRSAQMVLTSLEAGHSLVSRTDIVQEGLTEDEFAICDWIVRPRFKDEDPEFWKWWQSLEIYDALFDRRFVGPAMAARVDVAREIWNEARKARP